MFDKSVWSVVGYGVVVWGWREIERVERMLERFLRWVLGVDGRTPGYMVREELQRKKMRSRAVRRAWGFKERLREGEGGVLARRFGRDEGERFERGEVSGF